jgi:hypothetical protein
MNEDVPLCYRTLKLYLADKEPWFVTGNKSDVKTIPALATYLFDDGPYLVDPDRAKGVIKDRRHWGGKAYRIIFHRCLALLNRSGNRDWAELLSSMVKGSVSAQNYVLPYPSPESLFTKTKVLSGRRSDTEVKSRYIWSAVWVKGAGPASLLGEQGVGERCLAYDAYQIMEKAWDDHLIGFGGKLEGNADVEPAMPFTSIYTAQWHSLSSSELEDRLRHDAENLASREAMVEERWQARGAIVYIPYDLRSRVNPTGSQANDAQDAQSSGVSSPQESEDEQISSASSSAESSWHGSEYDDLRPRRRLRAVPRKKTGR